MHANSSVLVAVLSLVLALSVAPASRAAAASSSRNAVAVAAAQSLEAPHATETFTVGTLRVQRYGDQGRPLILIPGLEGGSWVWRNAIEHFRGSHTIYAVTLAGFDGLPMPKDHHDLMGQANASLLKLIQSRHIHKPVLIGHSLGGTLSIAFAEQHSNLISGVIAVDGLPIMPGAERFTPAQRKAYAETLYKGIADATPRQYQASILTFMQRMGTISAAKAKRYTSLNARSDQSAVAEYMKEDEESDYRPGLQNIHVPLLEISPYYAPDFNQPPVMMTEAQKADYYRKLLAGDSAAKVVSIAPSRHFVMLDQPAKLNQAITDFLKQL